MNKNLQELRSSLGFVLLCALNKAINCRIAGKRLDWNRTHEKKLTKLFVDIARPKLVRPQNIVHNVSTYELTAEEHHILTYGLDHHILTYGLDHHIPTKLNENEIKTEFEAFYYGLNKQLNHLPAVEKDELKSKLCRSCENYYKIKLRILTHGKNITLLPSNNLQWYFN